MSPSSRDLTLDGIYFQEKLWSAREWEILLAMPHLAAYLKAGSEAFTARGHTDHFGHLSPEPHARIETTLAEMRSELQSGHITHHVVARGRLFALLVQFAQWRLSRCARRAVLASPRC